jgi:hypothetical protein
MTWESQPAIMWLAVEAEIAVVCASAPALKVFFKHTFEVSGIGSAIRRAGYKLDRSSSTEDTGASGPSVDSGYKSQSKKSEWDASFDSEQGFIAEDGGRRDMRGQSFLMD